MACINCCGTKGLKAFSLRLGGRLQSLELCEACLALQDHGKALAFQKPGLTQLLNRALLFYPLIAPLRYQKLLQKTCSHCKTRLKDFFQTARLGCSHCFVEFEEVLVPLYEQIIRDSEANKNRRASEIQWGLRQLRQRLTEALEKEDYKEAAQLRDLLAQEEARHDGFFG